NLGDGNFSTARIPKHTYDTPGIYNVSLEITSNQGCKNTSVANHKVYVLESPDADFTANPLITNIESPDIDFSSLTPNDATEWLWNFDDGTTSDKLFLTHTYKDTGNYNVSLWEVNHLGCET